MSAISSLPAGPRQSSLRQLVRFARDPIGFVEECHARYGDVYTTRLAGLPPIVNFAKADAARDIFTSADGAMNGGDAGVPFEFLIGKSALIALDGARHKRERKLMMPPVHGERLAGFGAEMDRITDDVLSTLRAGQSVSLGDMMQEITIPVILQTVFGVAGDHPLKPLLSEFLALGAKPEVTVLSILLGGDRFRRSLGARYAPVAARAARFGGPLSRLPLGELARCIRDLEIVLADEIRRRKKTTEGRTDVMSLLINAVDEEGNGLSEAELRDEMMTLLVAGNETTATSLSWAIALCLAHPSALATLRAECAAVFTPSGEMDTRRIAELKYTDAVVRESLRLYPVGTGVMRRLMQPMTVGGVALPDNVMVLAHGYLVQRDPAIWPDPLRFDPSRFVDRKAKPHEWFPFGGGARTCLGMAFALFEMKIVLARFFRRVTARLEGRIPPLAPKAFLLGPESPIRLRIEAVAPARGVVS